MDLQIAEKTSSHFLGTRIVGRILREELEQLLCEYPEVVLDFKEVHVTQSFFDELLGVLILKNGPDILQRIVFKNCSSDVRDIINYVISNRINDFVTKNSH